MFTTEIIRETTSRHVMPIMVMISSDEIGGVGASLDGLLARIGEMWDSYSSHILTGDTDAAPLTRRRDSSSKNPGTKALPPFDREHDSDLGPGINVFHDLRPAATALDLPDGVHVLMVDGLFDGADGLVGEGLVLEYW